MNKKTILISAAVIALIGITALAIYFFSETPYIDENEIKLKIQLDLKEDIGLLVVDSEVNGKKESGGVSHADKSMIKRDETLYWSIDKEHYDNVSDTVGLILKFTVVTEYCDPNYENIYPEEYLIPLDGIILTADFGREYQIAITGDKTNGYRATVQ